MKCFAILCYSVVFLCGLGCLVLQLLFQFRMHVLGRRIKPRVIPPPRLSDMEDFNDFDSGLSGLESGQVDGGLRGDILALADGEKNNGTANSVD